MRNLNLNIAYYSTASKGTFGETLHALLSQISDSNRTPVRFVFFGIPQDNDAYASELAEMKRQLKEKYRNHVPIISYVAQKPLCNNALVLETHWTTLSAERNIHYKNFAGEEYIIIEDKVSKKISIGGVSSSNKALSIYHQSVEVFDKIKSILDYEEIPVDSIVRQWNYIQDITLVKGGKQHYQEFNDARSTFYSTGKWFDGYPAATGIGTYTGGVVVELFAIKHHAKKIIVLPIDNKLQIAAHEYTQAVLVSDEKSKRSATTPKFERAKAIQVGTETIMYVSGTAAIRGEETLEGVGIRKQTVATLENIFYLSNPENLNDVDIFCGRAHQLKSMRIYIKEEAYYEEAKEVVENMLPSVPTVYLLGDICRDNLLVEIEGIITNFED